MYGCIYVFFAKVNQQYLNVGPEQDKKMNRDGMDGSLNQAGMGKRQLVSMGQLLKVVTSIHHIDELFQWQGNAFIQYFHAQATQFWGLQANATSGLSTQLRAMVWQDTSIPNNVFANNQVALTVADVMSQGRSAMLQDVRNLFSPHQAELLMRYGINYCFCYLLKSSSLLPPAQNATDRDIPTGLSVVALLFLKRLLPEEELSNIVLLLERSIAIAASRGLLLPATATSVQWPASPAETPPQQRQLDLSELIPHRLESANAMRSSNPFATTEVIPDKQARRLYSAIDGRKNVAEVLASSGMDMKVGYAALHFLLTQHRVQLTEVGGQPVDAKLFFDRQ